MTNPAPIHSNDPYREWLRKRLGQEMGVREAEMTIQGAVQRRGWTAVRALGPRDVVAVLQDVYKVMRDQVGEGRADKWLEVASTDLAHLAETVPVPTITPIFTESTPRALRWGRRAHDLALLLARSHAEIAMRSLGAIRSNPDLSALETAAEWDVQATQAEVRRWETEDMLTNLRADHARVEVADQVAASRAQAELLFLRVAELEAGKGREQASPAQLAHSRLMLTQTTSFLDAFAPLVAEEDADTPLTMLDMNLDNARFSLGVPLHPNVLRARHTLNYAQWQAGEQGAEAPAVAEARRTLAQAEAEAGAQLHATLDAARQHQTALRQLAQTVEDLEARAVNLNNLGGDALSLALVRFEWRQARAAARIQSHRMEEAIRLLEALVSEPGDFR
ncbi:hypothetical protein E7T06_09065 [Deinococcus sp. Arct2-2]|uniref:hypothetical protein n=1 Tax=Deinococcus sp. Arct2-2 TaxID=2568653 RepID=UPI0010A5613C|nr:hypothetical protein [Deinococcus sp. Arct2-2]THF70047.1 hypothetical protein E7T06_09065 [Deinococcus sp. Arct2-2]